MEIRSPKTKSDFEKYFEFRWRMLREPWQQPRGSEQDELEYDSFHIMAIDENDMVIGVGRIHLFFDTNAQIRYMAVLENEQKKGIGQQLLSALENYAIKNKKSYIHLHARESAVDFYKKQNYQIIVKSHLLFSTIQHYKMLKILSI